WLSHLYYPAPPATLQDCFLCAGAAIITGPMRKNDPRAGRSHANARRRTRRIDRAPARRKTPARRDDHDHRPLVERILATPHLPQIVRQLRPALLHRLIERCGLEDCGELVALATPDQLSRVLDLDLWRASRPGLDEQFDAERFGTWVEVLMDCGAAVA